MSPALPAQPTTPIDLNALPALVADAIAAQPANRARVERAALILALRSICPIGRGYLVESEAQPGRQYSTTATACECADFLQRGLTCKHQWAVRFYEQLRAPRRCRLCGSTDHVGIATGECHECMVRLLMGEVA